MKMMVPHRQWIDGEATTHFRFRGSTAAFAQYLKHKRYLLYII